MYGKIFESMYDGTLSADWKAMVTFQQFIVLADSEGIVDYTPPALSRRTGIPLEILEHGIGKLQEPDPYSRSPEMDGQRISLIDEHRPWGWYIVNYDHYKSLASREDRREKDRLRKQKARDKSLNKKDVRSCPQLSAMSRHEDVDADVNEIPPTEGTDVPLKDQIWNLGPTVIGNSGSDRSFLGKLIKEHGEGSVLHALRETQKHGTGDPKSYIRGILREQTAVTSDGFGEFDD